MNCDVNKGDGLTSELYFNHINALQEGYESTLKGFDADGILIHSGSEACYFADDKTIDFNAYGHYLRWIPVNKPDQFLLFIPGKNSKYFQVVPYDYWYDQTVRLSLIHI